MANTRSKNPKPKKPVEPKAKPVATSGAAVKRPRADTATEATSAKPPVKKTKADVRTLFNMTDNVTVNVLS